MDTGLLKTDFARLLAPFPPVVSAYLFGSAATGHKRADSDVDIAVCLGEDGPLDSDGELRFQLMDIFETYFHSPADVVILNTASLKMIHQVLTYGILVYSRAPEQTRSFALRKRKEYFDFKYYIDRDIEQMKSFFQS